MQILKPWLIVCVAVCALSVRGADNERQAKAREALKNLQGATPQNAPAQPAPAQPEPTVPPPPTPPPVQPPPAPAPPPTHAAPPVPALTTPDANLPQTDPAAIAKAREAMRLKMQEVTAKEPPEPAPVAPPPTPAATPTPPPPPPAPAPPERQPAAVATPAVQPPIQPSFAATEEADPAAIAKAREALRLKMQQIEAEQPEPKPLTRPPAPSLTHAPPAAPPPPPAASTPPVPAAFTPAATAAAPPPPALPNLVETPGADPAAIEKAREAMRMRIETLPPSTTEPQLVGTSGYIHRTERVTAPMNFPAMSGPASPVSGDKQQLLDSLLLKYKADQITPEQYHAERAKILGGQ